MGSLVSAVTITLGPTGTVQSASQATRCIFYMCHSKRAATDDSGHEASHEGHDQWVCARVRRCEAQQADRQPRLARRECRGGRPRQDRPHRLQTLRCRVFALVLWCAEPVSVRLGVKQMSLGITTFAREITAVRGSIRPYGPSIMLISRAYRSSAPGSGA